MTDETQGIDVDEEVDVIPTEPMELSKEAVALTRDKNRLEAELAKIKGRLGPRLAAILDLMESEKFPTSSRVDGASVHQHSQVWASPAEGDHAALVVVLDELNLHDYLPKNVNSQSLSAFVREHLDPDESLTLEERLLSDNPKPMDPRLFDALKVTEKTDVRVTGA